MAALFESVGAHNGSLRAGARDLPIISKLIENTGMGVAQAVVCVLAGGVWFQPGAGLSLVSAVTRSVANEWSLVTWQRGAIVSGIFAGILLGNGLGGPLADIYGRRVPILLSYMGAPLFSVFASASTDYGVFCAFHVCVGFAYGVGQPAAGAMTTEVSPSQWRMPMMASSMSIFAIGEVYSAVLLWWDDPNMQHLHWRWLVAMGALPACAGLALSYSFLQQSPVHLANSGRYEEAKEVLSSMNRMNGKKTSMLDFKLPSRGTPREWCQQVVKQPISIIFSRKYFYSTMVMIYTVYTLNFSYYGCLYAFTLVLTQVDMGLSPAMSLMLGSLWGILGTIASVVLCMRLARKTTLALSCVGMGGCLMAFAWGATTATNADVRNALVHFGYIGIKLLPYMGNTCAYVYLSEIYPTLARGTGVAICMSVGGTGPAIAPLVFEWTMHYTGGFSVFLYILAAAQALNAALVAFLPLETSGKFLRDDEDTPLIGY